MRVSRVERRVRMSVTDFLTRLVRFVGAGETNEARLNRREILFPKTSTKLGKKNFVRGKKCLRKSWLLRTVEPLMRKR